VLPPSLIGLAMASQLALALSEMGEASHSFSQKPPLQPPATKTLTHKPITGVQLFTRKQEPVE